MDFALDSWIPYCKGSEIMIGLTTELVEALVGETHGGPPLNIARVLVTMGFVSSTPIELLLCSWEATKSDNSMQLLIMSYANTIRKTLPMSVNQEYVPGMLGTMRRIEDGARKSPTS